MSLLTILNNYFSSIYLMLVCYVAKSSPLDKLKIFKSCIASVLYCEIGTLSLNRLIFPLKNHIIFKFMYQILNQYESKLKKVCHKVHAIKDKIINFQIIVIKIFINRFGNTWILWAASTSVIVQPGARKLDPHWKLKS